VNTKTVFIAIGLIVIIAGAVSAIGLLKKTSTKTSATSIVNSNQENKVKLGSDICIEFPKEWVASVIGKNIIKTDSFNMGGSSNCQYFVDDTNAAFIKLENLSVEKQKTGQKALGRTITTDPRIKMENVIALQENGLINVIYLVLAPSSYVAIDRTSAKVFDNEGEIAFAIKVAQRIQDGQIPINIKNLTSTTTLKTQVPLPQEEDTIRSFFNIIREHKSSDAVSMFVPNQVGSDSQKQAWAVMFNAFEQVNIKNIESSMPQEWTNDRHTYKVTMDVKMKPESKAAVIPYYGYENGINVRFIILEKINNLWKIGGIATGP
jgi:hypothetical protein